MNTGSLVDLLTSVDVMPWSEVILGPVVNLVNSMFDVVGDVIALWPAGSSGAAGSIQDIVGSSGT
ncbi:hypothetical protein [Rhodococcus sp. SGAir0479]|uniref:hypothetical protein n=1 Tax=Rhodococcus sp. SGAir0479 TaxID=2567884 RepID=UPI0010CCDF93|nr:hypothetical protein [Rhodococcus sp. SGAir0479]QCQ92403.1 hypothetical protein E7742_15040 [Rhodococcus sp. SGAir0479]